MDLAYGGRQSGKTTWLIKRAAENDGLIITSNPKKAKCIFDMARKLGLNIREPMSVYEYVKLRGSFYKQRQCIPVMIDDAEECLASLLEPQWIDAMTVTVDNEVIDLTIYNHPMMKPKEWRIDKEIKELDDLLDSVSDI